MTTGAQQTVEAGSRRSEAPPEWMSERAVRWVGQLPAAAGRGLDALAKMPVIEWVMWPLSSVWVGIGTLLAIGIYVGIGSGFASIRAKLEMTDLEFFDAWPMQVLVTLLAVNLSVVTLRRIPLTLYKLGVWTVHVGILTLLTGSVWYFSHKSEGSVRIFMNQSVGDYYDATERALYVYKLTPEGKVDASIPPTMTPLPKLPIYYEHLASNGKALDRALPASALAGLDGKLNDARLKITGYYPYADLLDKWIAAEIDPAGTPRGEEKSPGILVNDGSGSGVWLAGNSPWGRIHDGPNMRFGIEYLHDPSSEKLKDLTAEVAEPEKGASVTVRIPKLHLEKTYILGREPVVVEGTPYTLTNRGDTAMQMASAGYKGAWSTCLTVQVERKDGEGAGKVTTFNRMVVSRFPEISPDFVRLEDGQQKRIQERVDNDIQLTFHDARRDQIWIVDRADGEGLELIHRKAGGGKVERKAIKLGETQNLAVGTMQLPLTVAGRTDHAVQVRVPVIVPPQFRERGQTAMDAMQKSVLEVELTRGDFTASRVHVPFVQFAVVGEPPLALPPAVVEIPGVGKLGILLSTTRRALPMTMKLAKFEATKYPGAMQMYEDYASTLEIRDKQSGAVETGVTHLNEPASSHGLSLFQVAWGGEGRKGDDQFSVIGVGNRPGLWVMIAGSVLMVVGIGYAFYVKPILLKRKKDWLAEWHRQRLAIDGNAGAKVR